MSFQKEPESQIDFLLHQHTNEVDYPPPLGYYTHGDDYRDPGRARNGDEHGSDDTVSDGNTTQIGSPISQYENLQSQVEDTQFVPVERDTQPTLDFDISPTTRRVLDDTAPNLANIPPPIVATPHLERLDTPVLPGTPEFRFGAPPKPNSMNLVRPLPGSNRPRQNQEMPKSETVMLSKAILPEVNRVSPKAANRSLPSRGGPPQSTVTYEQQLDSNLLATQSEPNPLPDQATVQNNEITEAGGSKFFSQTIEPVPVARSRPDETLPHNSKQPFEEVGVPLNTTKPTQFLDPSKTHSIPPHESRSPSQSRRQVKSKSPPFMEAAISSSLTPKVRGISTAAIIEDSSPGATRGSCTPKVAETQSSKANSSEGSSVELVQTNDTQGSSILSKYRDQPSTIAPTLPINMVPERLENGHTLRPTISSRDLSESGHVFQDLTTNRRPKSRNKDADERTSKRGTDRLPSRRSPTRPLLEHQLQSQDIRRDQNLHDIREARVSKKGSSKPKGACIVQSKSQSPNDVNGTISSAEVFHMASVMAAAEKEQGEKAVAKAHLQEEQIVDLNKENAALHNEIKRLARANEELSGKITGFKTRCDEYKANMNDVIKAHKELSATAKSLHQKKFEVLKDSARQKDAEVLKARAEESERSRAILKEARLKLDGQDQMINLLKRDVNNRLLDLQRERGLNDSLQKQLANKEEQHEELKLVLFGHQQSIGRILSGHEDMLGNLLNAGADNALCFNECRDLVKSLKESEPKPVPELVELNELVVALSTSVGEKLKAAEDGSIQVYDASAEVLAELKDRLNMLGEDHSAQRKLTASITDLREENAQLKERNKGQEADYTRALDQLSEIKEEFQKCRTQLTATTDDLSKALTAPREDPVLRSQLQDLQTSYSILKDQLNSSTGEIDRARENLHAHENSALVAQRETSKVQDKLRQSEELVSTFEFQKDAYMRKMKDESNVLRMQMERDFQARLAEDEACHSDIVSGLRRQISDLNGKLIQTQKMLQDIGQMSSSKDAETHSLSTQLSAVATELDCLQRKFHLMDQNRISIAGELRTSQEQLVQWMKKTAEWSARAEEVALEFAKRCKQSDDGLKKSEKAAQAEVDRLEALLLMLEKKSIDSDNLNGNFARYLRRMGLLNSSITFTQWAARLPSESLQQEETNLTPSSPSIINEQHEVQTLRQESYICGSQKNVSASSSSNEAHFIIPERAPFVGLLCGYHTLPLDLSSGLLGENYTGSLPETDSSFSGHEKVSSCFVSSSTKLNRNISTPESNLSAEPQGLTGTSGALSIASRPFPATEATLRSYLHGSHHFSKANARFNGTKRLEGTVRTVVPDSQAELTQEAIQLPTKPTRRIPERRHSTPCAPQYREGSKPITRTEVTECNIQTSETVDETLTVEHDVRGTVRFGGPAIDLKSIDSDSDLSSFLTDPVEDDSDNVESTDPLDDHDVRDRKDPVILQFSDKKNYADFVTSRSVPAPQPNSSRVRANSSVRPKGMKPPKSILKRPSTKVLINDTTVNAHSSEKTLKNTQISKMQGVHKGTVARRRLSRQSCDIAGINGATQGSPYNRIVSGNRVTRASNHFQGLDVLPQVPASSAADIFAISSSPAMGQPQRNSKKRALSGVSLNDSHRPAKLQRLIRH